MSMHCAFPTLISFPAAAQFSHMHVVYVIISHSRMRCLSYKAGKDCAITGVKRALICFSTTRASFPAHTLLRSAALPPVSLFHHPCSK